MEEPQVGAQQAPPAQEELSTEAQRGLDFVLGMINRWVQPQLVRAAGRPAAALERRLRLTLRVFPALLPRLHSRRRLKTKLPTGC
jgi:hypothetical protein